MSTHDPDDLAEQYEVVAGRKAPYTTVPDWITLHDDLEPQAKAVYNVLAMHVNVQKNDGAAWPSRKMIAEMLGWSREQSPDKYINQLEAAGAIDSEPFTRSNGAKGKRYYVHQTPPPGFTGPQTLKEWYERRRAALAAANSTPKLGRPRKSVAAAAAEAPKPAKKAPAKKAPAKKAPAKKAPAKKTVAKKSPAKAEKSEAEKALNAEADDLAKIWWERVGPRMVQEKKMGLLLGDSSKKFLNVRDRIRDALKAGYDRQQIGRALEEVANWSPAEWQLNKALAHQAGVQVSHSGQSGRQPIFTNRQWKEEGRDAGATPATPAAPDLDVFGVQPDDAVV
ncbi:hypothetical protein ACWDZ4_20685 [Streptomyces sp. NPDC003016]